MPSAVDGVIDEAVAIDLTASVDQIAAEETGVIDLSAANELTTSPEEIAPVTSRYQPYTFDRIPSPPTEPEPIEPLAPQAPIEQYAQTYAPPSVIEAGLAGTSALTPISEEPPVEAPPVVEPVAPPPAVEEPPKKKKKSWFRFGRRAEEVEDCLLYTSPSPRDRQKSRMPSSA